MAIISGCLTNRSNNHFLLRRDGILVRVLWFDKALGRRYHKVHFLMIDSTGNVAYPIRILVKKE